jgi:hypothetical protein
MAAKRKRPPTQPSSPEEAPRDARVKRPRLPRTEPIRSWSTLFGAGREGNNAGASAGAQPKAADPIGRGVEMGYRVIDEYVRQGAAVASNFMNAGSRVAPGADLSQLADRMIRYATDFSSAWLEAMTMMASSFSSAAPNGATAGAASAVRSARPESTAGSSWGADLRLSLDLRSEHPTQVSVNLEGSVPGEFLEVEPMRARTGKAVLQDVAIELPGEPGGTIRVKVHVPPGSKKNRYTGAIIETKSRKPRGRLTVILGP